VRTIGSEGSGAGQLQYPDGVAIDGDGRIVVCDTLNYRLQVLP
jgi:sugar lactone lactonase YvrE